MNMWRLRSTVSAFFLVAIIGCASLDSRSDLTSVERRHWKAGAIREIARHTSNANQIADELAVLKTNATNSEDYEAWLSDHLILMKNGEWLCFANACAKEESAIHDLFLAKGSNGTWYYSTFHFCVRMLNLKAADQPESIAEFLQTYSVHAFDGQSEECLKSTWPNT
jgi:hypothetical protein